MMYEVKPLPPFIRQLEDLIQSYPSLKQEIIDYFIKLENSGVSGVRIPGKNKVNYFWKDRLPLTDQNIGKRGGLRIICYQNPENHLIIIPAMIYPKSKLSHPTNKMFKELLQEIQSL
jgi:mRNA-degrading endonuclease RelE of RelBE toxin-antitoxin system